MNFKDPKILAVIGVLALVLVFGGLFLLTSKKSAPEESAEETQSETIPSLSKDDLGLTLELSDNKKQVKVVVNKASDIKNLEGDITYDADSNEDKSVKVPQDISFNEEVSGSSFETKFFDLATCSKNVCRYHTGIEEIELMMKVTKKDGKVYQATDTIPYK